MAKNEDGSVKDDGTLYGYYSSRREDRLKRDREDPKRVEERQKALKDDDK